MVSGMKRVILTVVASVALSACASDIPPAPKQVTEAWPSSSWEAPPNTAVVRKQPQPRATTFAVVRKRQMMWTCPAISPLQNG